MFSAVKYFKRPLPRRVNMTELKIQKDVQIREQKTSKEAMRLLKGGFLKVWSL